MSALVKIPRVLLLEALADLERPHPFAGERLGFFSFRQSLDPEEPHLLCFAYHSIPDEQYVKDPRVVAKIAEAAIHTAMSRTFSTSAGQLWVHTHGCHGYPAASGADRHYGPKVAQSCANAQPKSLQGWAVISEDGITGEMRDLAGVFHPLDRLAVVGWPLVIPPRPALPQNRNRRANDRYSRQSFLGPQAQGIIARAKIGIVGLGGGGSHLVQQLAHIGFQRVVFCDAQRIESTNLNRLVSARLQDVRRKRFKAEIAARLYRSLQPDALIDDRPLTWEDKRSALRQCDLIFGAIDGFARRRDLEAFCRAQMVPLMDIGMAVLRPEGALPEIRGQVILSMPGGLCMHCLQFLTEANLAEEARRYDDLDPQPQVVWTNGVLASNAIGFAMALLTGWAGQAAPSCRLNHRGSQLTMTPCNIAAALAGQSCMHYPLARCGDPVYRKL